MTTHRESQPASSLPSQRDDSNPWLIGLWLAAAGAALVGIILTTQHTDVEAFDYNPTAAAIGHTLLGVAGVLLAGLMVAGAICWQLKRR